MFTRQQIDEDYQRFLYEHWARSINFREQVIATHLHIDPQMRFAAHSIKTPLTFEIHPIWETT